MKDFFLKILTQNTMVHPVVCEKVSTILSHHVLGPEFSELYARRTDPAKDFDLGLGNHVNQLWSNVMSSLVAAFSASVETLKSHLATSTSGLTAEQVDAHIAAVVTPIKDQITVITNSEKSAEDKITEITAALQSFTDAFPATPTPAATVEATPAPTEAAAPAVTEAPAPSPEPTTAPAPEATQAPQEGQA